MGHAFLLLLALLSSTSTRAEKHGKPLVIHLEPFGIPRGLFGSGGPMLCLHEHAAATRLFWLDDTHLFAAFTTNPPCTLHSNTVPPTLRGLVFDATTGVKVASHDWPITEETSLFPGPDHSIVVRNGNSLELLNQRLEKIEAGELEDSPKGMWSTPRRRTVPLLSSDGRRYEFYAANPLRLLDTISLDATDEVRAIPEWIAGDERIAGSRCTAKSVYSCTKIVVLTSDAKFLEPDGAPWSYQETEKPVWLQPIGFLDATHLLIEREDSNFFHSAQVLIVTPNGSRIQLPALGSLYPRKIAGIAVDGSRFGIALYALGGCTECVIANFFAVAEPDAKKFLFERRASPYMSAGELSPDGKWMAILDDDTVTLYPMPGSGERPGS